MSLVFYAPRFGYPEQTGVPSPEFLIRRDSPDGQLLTAAFKQQEQGLTPFGSKLASLDAPDMIRVRVRIRRLPATADSAHAFELVSVLACHWLTLSDTTPARPPSAPPSAPGSAPASN